MNRDETLLSITDRNAIKLYGGLKVGKFGQQSAIPNLLPVLTIRVKLDLLGTSTFANDPFTRNSSMETICRFIQRLDS